MLGERLFSTLIPALALICFKNRQCCFPRARPALLAQSCLVLPLPVHPGSWHCPISAPWDCCSDGLCAAQTQPEPQYPQCCWSLERRPSPGAVLCRPEPSMSFAVVSLGFGQAWVQQCLNQAFLSVWGPPEGSGSSLVCHSILFRVRAWP